MNRFLLSALSVVFIVGGGVLPSLAQTPGDTATLRVRVRDHDGIIPNATVRVAPSADGVAYAAATDGEGVATFPSIAPGTYEISGEFPGYAPAAERGVRLAAADARTVELLLELAQLSTTVTVTTANRREQLLLDVAEPTLLIDREQIDDTGARSAKDVLIEYAGAGVQVNAGGGQGHISINGVPNSGVLVLLNGRRYLGKDANGNLNLEDLQLAGIDRIEIVKGASSALYGSDALGGVVNLVTSGRDARGLHNTVAFTGGSYGDVRFNDTLSLRGVKGGLNATGGYRTYNGFDLQPENAQTIGQPAGQWWNANAAADYRLNPSLFARLFVDYQRRDIDRYFFAGATQLASTVYNSIRDLTRYTLAPELEFLPSPVSSVLVQYNHGKYSRDETRVFTQSGQTVPQAPWREWSRELKLTGRRDWSVGGRKHPLQGGYEVRHEQLTRGTLLPSSPSNPFGQDEKDRRVHVLWLQQEAQIRQLTLTGGARYDNYSDFGAQWSPKASALFAITRVHKVRAGYGKGFRPPYFNELHLNTPPFFVGNPDLKPESADTYSAGYSYARARAQFATDVFFNKVRNGIVFDLRQQPFTYGNLNRYDSSGATISAVISLAAGFTPSASYTYNTRENEEGVEIGGFPKHTAFLKLLWQEPRLGVRANIRTQINGRIPPGVTDTSYQNGYQVWYGQVSKSFVLSGSTFELFAQVDNIFNERDLYRRQTCPANAPAACAEGAPVDGVNDLLQVWIAPRTFQLGVTVNMDWVR